MPELEPEIKSAIEVAVAGFAKAKKKEKEQADRRTRRAVIAICVYLTAMTIITGFIWKEIHDLTTAHRGRNECSHEAQIDNQYATARYIGMPLEELTRPVPIKVGYACKLIDE